MEQLIEAGDGKRPLTVVINGDKVMVNAIKVVLSEARHRLCLWHILQNVKTRGGSRFASGFMKCVDKYQRPEDFEKGRQELVAYHKLEQKSGFLICMLTRKNGQKLTYVDISSRERRIIDALFRLLI